MAYGQVLNEIIKKNGLTFKKVAELCKERGNPIDPSYISKLVNGKIPPPSNEVTSVLSKVLGVNEDILISEAYLENAPKPIIDFIRNARASMSVVAKQVFDLSFPADQSEIMKQFLDNMPLAEFIIEVSKMNLSASILDIDNSILSNSILDNEDNNESFTQSIGLPVNDDSMYPMIPKGSLVSLVEKAEYENGDIIYFVCEDITSVRKLFVKNDVYVLFTLNSVYDPLIYNRNDIKILGKVSKVISSL